MPCVTIFKPQVTPEEGSYTGMQLNSGAELASTEAFALWEKRAEVAGVLVKEPAPNKRQH
jgi:hypothetical protein